MSSKNLGLKWNLDDLEVKTKTVEKTLEPLVIQVKNYRKANIFDYFIYIMSLGDQFGQFQKFTIEKRSIEKGQSAFGCIGICYS